jgi:hypothetical protein
MQKKTKKPFALEFLETVSEAELAKVSGAKKDPVFTTQAITMPIHGHKYDQV